MLSAKIVGMKRLKFLSISVVILFLLCIIFSNSIFADELNITSPNYAVYNADNLELLIGKNENEKISIASITKLMTAVVCVDNIKDLSEKIVIDTSIYNGMLDPELSVAGIVTGQEISYYDLLATMLIPSGADSALYIACTSCGNYDTFIEKMNEKAKELGMENSHFSNPTGLDDDNNYSTLNDVAKLVKYAISNPTIKEIISTDKYTTSDGRVKVSGTIYKLTSSYLIDRKYIKGGKTGTTEDAGICLASYSVDDDGTELITVVTGASMFSSFPFNISDTESIDEYIINNYSIKDILTTNDILLTLNTYCTKEDEVNFYPDNNIKYYMGEMDNEKIKIEYSGVDTLTIENYVGEKVGEAKVYYRDILVDTVDIIIKDELHFSVVKWIKIHKEPIITIGLVTFSILVLIIVLSSSGKKRTKDRKRKNKHK